jgi:hypothetical protein
MAKPEDRLIHDLLELHRALLELTKRSYEQEHGAVGGAGELLQLVIGHETFAWLRPLSRLMVDLDDRDALAAAGGARPLAQQVWAPGTVFQQVFADVAREAPHVVPLHEAVQRAIDALPEAPRATA